MQVQEQPEESSFPFCRAGRPRDVVGGTISGVEDIVLGLVLGGAYMVTCGSSLAKGELTNAALAAGGAVVLPVAGAVVGAGEIAVGAVGTLPALFLAALGERFDPVTRKWVARPEDRTYVGSPSRLVGRMIFVNDALALITEYHPSGVLNGQPGIPGQHTVRYHSGPRRDTTERLTLKRACKKGRVREQGGTRKYTNTQTHFSLLTLSPTFHLTRPCITRPDLCGVARDGGGHPMALAAPQRDLGYIRGPGSYWGHEGGATELRAW